MSYTSSATKNVPNTRVKTLEGHCAFLAGFLLRNLGTMLDIDRHATSFGLLSDDCVRRLSEPLPEGIGGTSDPGPSDQGPIESGSEKGRRSSAKRTRVASHARPQRKRSTGSNAAQREPSPPQAKVTEEPKSKARGHGSKINQPTSEGAGGRGEISGGRPVGAPSLRSPTPEEDAVIRELQTLQLKFFQEKIQVANQCLAMVEKVMEEAYSVTASLDS